MPQKVAGNFHHQYDVTSTNCITKPYYQHRNHESQCGQQRIFARAVVTPTPKNDHQLFFYSLEFVCTGLSSANAGCGSALPRSNRSKPSAAASPGAKITRLYIFCRHLQPQAAKGPHSSSCGSRRGSRPTPGAIVLVATPGATSHHPCATCTTGIMPTHASHPPIS